MIRRALAPALCLVLLRCTLLAPSDEELRGSGRVEEAGPADAGPADAGEAGIAESYTVISELTNWSSFDLGAAASASANDFAGGCFDGRYVYFAPASGSFVARYDSQAPFAAVDSWSVFDTTSVNAKASRFQGAVFDGRYVYLVPHGPPNGVGSVLARYDTERTFGAKESWTSFDTNLIDVDAEGFEGAAFDGRYLYFIPQNAESKNANGMVTRYDTTGELVAKSSWTTFDTTVANSEANGYGGGVFDGRYVYLVPYDNGSADGVAARVDTTAAFGASASWEFFKLDDLMPSMGGFFGAAFDGRHVYFAPSAGTANRAIRFDTRGTFRASWTAFDLGTVNLGGRYAGAAFDGRYVYFVPGAGTKAIRFDSRASFSDPTAWSGIDPRQVNAKVGGFVGAIFDGSAVYYAPKAGSVVLRYQARTPPALPVLPAFRGSFF